MEAALADRFLRALPIVLAHEGGFAEHADDPGGATMRGVTQATYAAWRRRMGLPVQSVQRISDEEIEDIYRDGYWNAIRGDELPSGVAYAVFDAGVMSGPGRAVRWLQEAAGVQPDGIVGPRTLAAVQDLNASSLVIDICDARLRFCKSLRHWPTFGRGWGRRIAAVERQALAWAADLPMPEVAPAEAPLPKARGEVAKTATIVKHAQTLGGAAAAAAPLAKVVTDAAATPGPLGWAIAAAIVICAVTVAMLVLNKRDSEGAA